MPLATFAVRSATVAVFLVALIALTFRTIIEVDASPAVLGMDAKFYFERAGSWLAGTGFYLPWQLTGESYLVENGAATYPPPILLLLVPFASGVPAFLWWAIPGLVMAFALRSCRPSPWGWLLLAATLLYPRTWVVVALGNPSMWIMAAVAAGRAWGWPSVAVLLKPTLAPLALIGARRPGWTIALAIAVLLALPFGPLWLDYVTVVLQAQTSRGIEYVLGEWPIALAVLASTYPVRVWSLRPPTTSAPGSW